MNESSVEEATLIASWQRGDRAAGCELLRRYVPTLATYFRCRTHSHVDELLQRTLVACSDAIVRFEGRSSFRSFLLGIARNQFLTSLRGSTRPTEAQEGCATMPEDGPSQLVASKQEVQVLVAALTEIGSPFRDVLRMFYWEGMSVEHIASALAIAPGTVKSRLGRGRAMLKEQIDRDPRPQCQLVQKLVP